MATQSEFMEANNPYSSLPTRARGESLYDYLIRLSQARGGMMLGEASPTVDDVVAEEITTQPLGVLIKQDTGDDGGDNNNRDTRTPEQRKTDMMERAVGLLTGEAASAVGLGSIAGPAGMLLGGFADYDTISQFENQLASKGYTPEQIEAIKENPSMLQQGLTSGQFGVVSEGYKPTIVDKFSITGLFSDIFGEDKPASEGANVPGITGLGNVGARTQTYPGAVDFSRPSRTYGLMTGQQPFNVTPGYGTVLAPGYTPATAATGVRATSPYGWGMMTQPTVSTVSNTTNTAPTSPIGQQAYGGTVVGVDAAGNLNIDRTGNGIADVRTGVSPNTGLVNTYNFNLEPSNDNGSGGTGTDYQGPSPVDGGSGSDFGGYGYGSEDNASNDWGGFGSEEGYD